MLRAIGDIRSAEAQEMICEYHSTLSAKAQERNLQALRDGICRIMVCTDAVGMGLDVPDIARIVQWRVPPSLTVSGWWQRAGRAARDPKRTGVAIVYYNPAFQVQPESPFCGRPNVEADLKNVYTASKPNATSSEDDEDAIPGRRSKGDLPCEGQMLWYLNTKGCLRDVAMHYLGSKPEVRHEFNEQSQGAPCCCRCYHSSKVSPDLFKGFDVRICTPFVRSNDDNEDLDPDTEYVDENVAPDSQKSTRSAQRSNRIRLAVRHALDIWRHRILSKYSPIDNMLQPKHILTDAMIDKLEKHCFDIKQASDIAQAVWVQGRNILKRTRVAGYTSELAELILEVVEAATDPELPPWQPGTPWIGGDPKPLYCEADIHDTVNPVVSGMMDAANRALRRFDLVAANSRETTRLKRQKNASEKRQKKVLDVRGTVTGACTVRGRVASSTGTETEDEIGR
jgi:hypothetical protein